MTRDVDLAEYRQRLDANYEHDTDGTNDHLFRGLYDELADRGFELIEYSTARAETLELRRLFDAPMEYLIDLLEAPRGFWGHKIGHRVHAQHPTVPDAT